MNWSWQQACTIRLALNKLTSSSRSSFHQSRRILILPAGRFITAAAVNHHRTFSPSFSRQFVAVNKNFTTTTFSHAAARRPLCFLRRGGRRLKRGRGLGPVGAPGGEESGAVALPEKKMECSAVCSVAHIHLVFRFPPNCNAALGPNMERAYVWA